MSTFSGICHNMFQITSYREDISRNEVLSNMNQCFANKFHHVSGVLIPKVLKFWMQLRQLIAPPRICKVLAGWYSLALINHGSLWPILVNLPLFYGV
jgi:hypothetical protein